MDAPKAAVYIRVGTEDKNNLTIQPRRLRAVIYC